MWWVIKGIFQILWEIVSDPFQKEGDIWAWVKDHPEKWSKITGNGEEV